MAALGDIATFDPLNVSDLTAPVLRNLYNTLIRLDRQRRATPEILERWSIADNGRTLVLKLRSGIKFHTGRNASADDLKATLDRARDWEHGLAVHDFAVGIQSVEKKDQTTVAVHFAEPSPFVLDLLDVLALCDLGVVQQLDKQDGGTGCFMLVERAPADHLTLRRFDQYWMAGRPRLDTVIVKFFNEEMAVVSALANGAIDLATDLSGAAAAEARQDRLIVERMPVPRGLDALVLNPTRPPFDQRDVRQAVQLAIDRHALARQAPADAAEPALGFFLPGSPADDASMTSTGQPNPQRAKALLDGRTVGQAKLTLLVGQHRADWGPLADAIKEALTEIGLSIEIWSAPVGQWFVALNGGQFHLALSDLDAGLRDPATIAWNVPLRTIGNRLWPNGVPTAYADAVKTASQAVDEGQRRQAWRAVHQALIAESWVIPLLWRYHFTIARRRIVGLDWTLAGQLLLQDAAFDA